jgi:protocatechuate 4,5-dioxygenase alpha chain
MTAFGAELALYELGVKRAARSAFASDPDGFLRTYRLTEDELKMIKTFDVAALQSIGVSPLLTLGFWMMNDPRRSRVAYLDRLNGREPSGEI